MLWGNRDPQTPGGQAKRRAGFQPKTEGLEGRLLMAIDLANTPTAPYGVQLAGSTVASGIGYSVADLGDVNGDGYDDFLVGAPTVVRSGTGNTGIALGNGANAKAFLVFGSLSVTAGNVDWGNLVQQQRTGTLDATTLNSATQTNPLNGSAGFTFAGLTFTASKSANSLLGASVTAVGDIAGTGFNSFMIGAPGATDANGLNPGTGRAYLVYGTTSLVVASTTSSTIDLDNPPSGINVVTFVNSGSNSSNWQTGASVAGVGDVITDGIPDIAIGAPGASIGNQANSGAVYVVSGATLRTPTTRTVDLTTVGATSNTTTGVIFAGENPNARFGSSLSAAGNIDGARTTGNSPIADFLIGSVGQGLAQGAAYLVYGSPTLPAFATVTNTVNYVNAGRIGVATGTNVVVPGVYFQGSSVSGQAGFSVSSAGDFNADGLSDILIGSPGASLNAGKATLIFGKSIVSGHLSGQFDLDNLPSTLAFATFTGANFGDVVGYSVGLVGRITPGQPNPILVGAPGFNNGDGAAYLIPGNPDLQGPYSLTASESQPIAATRINASGSAGGGGFFGSAVASRLVPTGASRTIDNDAIGDFVIGAPGYGLTTSNLTAGTVFALQGRFIPLQLPISTAISTFIGVGSAKPPFSINATTPTSLDIFVYSNNTITPAFRPATQINPATVVINGVAYPTATIRADPIDENGDGITDAIITITPRGNLNLPNGTSSITVSGRTFNSGTNPNVRWTGTATVSVTGSNSNNGGGGGTTAGSTGVAGSNPAAFSALPPYGGRLVPTLQALSRLNYKAIPQTVALQQFKPAVGWRARLTGTGRLHTALTSANSLWGAKYSHIQLAHHVFTRGLYKKGEVIRFTHKAPVVPTQYQSQPQR